MSVGVGGVVEVGSEGEGDDDGSMLGHALVAMVQ